MTCLLSKYPVKYVKKILQKLQKFIIYCRQLLPNAWQCRKPATGSSLRTHGDKKTAIIILFIMMAVTYSILSYLIFISENDFYFLFLIPCRLCMLSDDLLLIFFAHSFKSTIHVSLHILIISLNMWYSVQYVCSSFYRPVYIFSVCSIFPNLLYRPFIYYNKGLFSGNFYLPYH